MKQLVNNQCFSYFNLLSINILLLVSVFLYFVILVFTVMFLMPDILDFVAPLNEPRRHQLPMVFEPLFFDQEKHFLFIMLNFLIIAFVMLTIFLSVETLYMICIQHACGLLKLTRYDICYCVLYFRYSIVYSYSIVTLLISELF